VGGSGVGAVVGGVRGAIAGAPAAGVGAIPGAIAGASEGAAEYGARGAKQGGTLGRRFGKAAGKRAGKKAGEEAAGRLARAASVDQQAKLRLAQSRQAKYGKSLESRLPFQGALEGKIDTTEIVTRGAKAVTTSVFSISGAILALLSAIVGIGMMFSLAVPPLAVILFIVLLILGIAQVINKFLSTSFKQSIGVFEKTSTIIGKNT